MSLNAAVRRVVLAGQQAVVVAGVICLACGGRPQTLTGPTTVPLGTRAQTPAVPDAAPPPIILPTEYIVGAGDIGMCGGSGNPQATARLVDGIDGTVVTLGDNAYPSGSAANYKNCYDPSWGRFKARTRPVPGNHEYDSEAAQPYFDYFGTAAGPVGAGYYSYDLGNWHVVALNSSAPVGANSAQAAWLRNDLAANTAKCELAYFHYPLFSSSEHGNIEAMHAIWQVLYDAGVDVVLSGHDHTYERFSPQDPGGAPDPVNGIREFVVGTGGAAPYPFVNVRPNSEVRLSTNGVIKLALKYGGYDWTFISTSGPGDSGSGTCH